MRNLLSVLAAAFSLTHGQWVQTQGPALAKVTTFVESDGKLFATTESGNLYATSDSGERWNPVPLGFRGDTLHSLAAYGKNLYLGTSSHGLLRTVDGGKTWASLNKGLTNLSVRAFVSNGTNLFAGTSSGLFRSSDQGANWTLVPEPAIQTAKVTALAVIDKHVFVIARSGGYPMWRSDDDGATWTTLFGAGCCGGAGMIVKDRLLFVRVLGVASEGGLYRSDNLGNDWKIVWNSTGAGAWTYSNAAALAVGGGELYLGTTHTGLFRSKDDGTTWTPLLGVPLGMNAKALVRHGTTLFAAVDSGVVRSTDDGATWTMKNQGFADGTVKSVVESKGAILAATDNHGVFRSVDGGATWKPILKDVFPYQTNPLFNYGDTLFTGADGLILRSSDGGASWTRLPVPDAMGFSAFAKDGKNLYAGFGDSPWGSTDNGATWKRLCGHNMVPECRAINVSSLLAQGPNIMFGDRNLTGARSLDGGNSWLELTGLPEFAGIRSLAYHGGYIFAGSYGLGLHRSADNGATWARMTQGLGSRLIRTMLSAGTILLAGSDDGIFRSDDSGSTWYPYNQGLDGVGTLSLALGSDHLLAATSNHAVWRRPRSDLITALRPRHASGETGFGSQTQGLFREGALIDIVVQRKSRIKLTLHDSRGRLVSTLQDALLPSGTFPVRLESQGSPGGIYFLRLQADGSIRTRRVILE